MSDLISASSLLMAAITVLFSLWYPEIIGVLNQKEAKHAGDNLQLKKSLTIILCTKSIPLTILSLGVFLTFLPNVIVIILDSIKQGLPTLETYSAVNTAFCLVSTICLGLTFYIFILSIMLVFKRVRLK